MRVYLGKYKSFFGIYQLADLLQYVCVQERHRDKIVEMLSDTWVEKTLNWIDSKKKRLEYVHIDGYDAWNADNSLALIALPLMRRVKEDKHGASFISDEDVPEELRSHNAAPKENEWDTDEFWFKRFDWVVDEIIWALEKVIDDSWEDQFWEERPEIDFDDENEDGIITWKSRGKFDKEGYKAYNARIDNGLRLLGTYWRAMWT